ncbi:NAD(P)-binding protein [Periconia macrospinosa]|uniref:NAD(P)-binding protein n=1 Tax=Periconia macrospinosa TaxID=97972 RepID=A0A2V1DRI5_9PLEO|nr:NAD(P)-binding protein [Periconia macrospinosa]
MSAASKVILIFGSGPRTGQKIAVAFATKGYKVAETSRSAKEDDGNTEGSLKIKTDLSNPESVSRAFEEVKAKLGTPSVVVYNASAVTFADKKSPLSISVSDFTQTLNINVLSAYLAAKHAAEGFSTLPETAARTFIYTGNATNEIVLPGFLDQGVGKSGAAHMMKVASTFYAERGFKFYYADERTIEGAPVYMAIDGEAHGRHYADLAEGDAQGPWQQTFVKNEGYKKF